VLEGLDHSSGARVLEANVGKTTFLDEVVQHQSGVEPSHVNKAILTLLTSLLTFGKSWSAVTLQLTCARDVTSAMTRNVIGGRAIARIRVDVERNQTNGPYNYVSTLFR